MLSQKNKQICIFGDSHFACLKHAFDQGMVEAPGVDVEFWGNIGKRFRYLGWRNEQVEPLDAFTAERFAKTNVHGRTALNAGDFDMILFMGCRIDLYRIFPELLHRRRSAESWLSSGVEQRWIQDFLHRVEPYQFARRLAVQEKASIAVTPIPFDTQGFEESIPPDCQAARTATAEDRGAIWSIVARVMQMDGITLLPQPERTVVDGCCTDAAYAVKDYETRQDRTHKNPQFGALMLAQAVDWLREDPHV